MVDSSCFIMAENTENSSTILDEMEQSQHKKAVSDLLADKGARDLMIEKLKVSSHVAKESTITAFSTISGYNAGGGTWPAFPMQFPFAAPLPPFWGPAHTSPMADTPQEIPLCGSARLQDLLMEDTEGERKETTLFGGGFLEPIDIDASVDSTVHHLLTMHNLFTVTVH